MFPMLTDEELRALADSIKTRGQINPILLDCDGVLLDGRNRLAACELAGIEPRFTTYDGDNPVSVILSYNLHRRHVSRGQEAIIVALARSLSEHSMRADAATYGISITRLSIATTVVQHATHLAEQVRVGTLGLDAAYETARKHKAETEAINAQYQQLRDKAPDLAEKATHGECTLPEALAELDRQQAEEQLRRRVAEMDAIRMADGLTEPRIIELAERGDITWHQAAEQADQYLAERQEKLQHAQQALEHLAATWPMLQDLARRPNSTFTRDVLNGLTVGAVAFIDRLIALQLTSEAADRDR
jgi:hypothetical protein